MRPLGKESLCRPLMVPSEGTMVVHQVSLVPELEARTSCWYLECYCKIHAEQYVTNASVTIRDTILITKIIKWNNAWTAGRGFRQALQYTARCTSQCWLPPPHKEDHQTQPRGQSVPSRPTTWERPLSFFSMLMYVRYDFTRTELAIFKSLQHSAGHLAFGLKAQSIPRWPQKMIELAWT